MNTTIIDLTQVSYHEPMLLTRLIKLSDVPAYRVESCHSDPKWVTWDKVVWC